MYDVTDEVGHDEDDHVADDVYFSGTETLLSSLVFDIDIRFACKLD